MTTFKAFLALCAFALIAGLSTAAVIAGEQENTKFPHERMVEIKRMMGGSI
ncbi:MAG: hypothetical protein AAF366_14765 [Pseudomonadota bacterium]